MTASLPAHTQTPTWQPYAALISQVVLAERLREVRALVDFTQLEPLGELGDPDLRVEMVPVPLARSAPTWTPAAKAAMMMLIGSMISLHSQGLAVLFDVQTSCTCQ